MDSKLEMLLDKLKFEEYKNYFEEGRLIQIVGNKDHTVYTFYLEINNTLPVNIYEELYTNLINFYKDLTVKISISVLNPNYDIILEYFTYFINRYSKKGPMLSMFLDDKLEFKDGKIVKASCDGDNDKLNEIFNTDDGARYVGEFSFGVNSFIRKPMGDILYDEKICGSIHFTPGRCYENANNGNISSIHWDLVLIQRDEYGGGEIYFDDVLIRKNGKFVLNELKNINFD